MTWNDLISLLNEIPENRREEEAVFLMRDETFDNNEDGFQGEVFIIDCKEEIALENLTADATVGNQEDTGTTFVLAQ